MNDRRRAALYAILRPGSGAAKNEIRMARELLGVDASFVPPAPDTSTGSGRWTSADARTRQEAREAADLADAFERVRAAWRAKQPHPTSEAFDQRRRDQRARAKTKGTQRGDQAKRKTCHGCGGTGHRRRMADPGVRVFGPFVHVACPACGGSGYARRAA